MNSDADSTDTESNNVSDDEGSLIPTTSSLIDEEEFTIHNEFDMNLLQPSFSGDNNKDTVFDVASIGGSVSAIDVKYGSDLEEPYVFMSSSQNQSGVLQCNDYNDFVIANNDPDIPYKKTAEETSEFTSAPIPTSNIGKYAVNVVEDASRSGAFKDMLISGHFILNQCGSLLMYTKHQMKGSSLHR
eukprot:12178124-Ditylum_brightwellii.AAC.1